MGAAIAIGIIGGLIAAIILLIVLYADDWNVDFEEFSLGEGAGVRIAHLSDLHFPKQRVYTSEMLKGLQAKRVDIVVITGDLIGGRANPDTCGAFPFVKELVERYPVFYVRGNHEQKNKRCQAVCSTLEQLGVNVVEKGSFLVEYGDVRITVCGASPNGTAVPPKERADRTVLLLHRPEQAQALLATEAFKATPPDLILAGHAHGGQFRIFGRGLFAPGQGVLPKYTSGRYNVGEQTEMIVSRGIGASEFPFRLNNRPHVPIITVGK